MRLAQLTPTQPQRRRRPDAVDVVVSGRSGGRRGSAFWFRVRGFDVTMLAAYDHQIEKNRNYGGKHINGQGYKLA